MCNTGLRDVGYGSSPPVQCQRLPVHREVDHVAAMGRVGRSYGRVLMTQSSLPLRLLWCHVHDLLDLVFPNTSQTECLRVQTYRWT